jgi:hypothetical protein
MTGGDFTGTNPRTDCSLSGNTGCGVQGTDAQFGEDFNSAGGGVYVVSLQDSLKVWVFQRSNIPADITSGSPDPSGWGKPLLDLESASGCDIASNFIDQSVVRLIYELYRNQLLITDFFSFNKNRFSTSTFVEPMVPVVRNGPTGRIALQRLEHLRAMLTLLQTRARMRRHTSRSTRSNYTNRMGNWRYPENGFLSEIIHV